MEPPHDEELIRRVHQCLSEAPTKCLPYPHLAERLGMEEPALVSQVKPLAGRLTAAGIEVHFEGLCLPGGSWP